MGTTPKQQGEAARPARELHLPPGRGRRRRFGVRRSFAALGCGGEVRRSPKAAHKRRTPRAASPPLSWGLRRVGGAKPQGRRVNSTFCQDAGAGGALECGDHSPLWAVAGRQGEARKRRINAALQIAARNLRRFHASPGAPRRMRRSSETLPIGITTGQGEVILEHGRCLSEAHAMHAQVCSGLGQIPRESHVPSV